MRKIRFYFGVRAVQDMPEYPSGPAGNFKFEVSTHKKIETIKQATGLLYRFKRKFLKELKKQNISCKWQVIPDRQEWIPTCYLRRPKEIEVVITID